MSSGKREPFTFSKSNAGPPARITRWEISVISRNGSTSWRDPAQLAALLQQAHELAQAVVVSGHARPPAAVRSAAAAASAAPSPAPRA